MDGEPLTNKTILLDKVLAFLSPLFNLLLAVVEDTLRKVLDTLGDTSEDTTR